MGKQENLKTFILNEIRMGRLKPGDKLYSRSIFMEKFTCARATIDQAISDLTQRHILRSVRGSGTFVSKPAEPVAGKDIAIAAPIIGHPSMPQEMIRGFLETLGANNGIRYFTYEELKHPRSWEECKAQRGIVFIQPDVQHSPLLYETRSQKIAHVILYRDPPESSFVSIDNHGAIAGLVDALRAQGRKRIAYACIRESRYPFPEQRYSGYLEGLLRNNLPFNKKWVAFITSGNDKTFIDCLFKNPQKPDAVIADQVPLGLIIKAAETFGLVPGHDISFGQMDAPPKNTYAFPVFATQPVLTEIGREGARIFTKLRAQPETVIQKYITPQIIEC